MKNKIIKLTASISLYNVYASIYVRSMKHSLGKAYFNSESLRDNCITHRKYKIWDTPHYKFLNKKPYLYFNYINKTDQMDHSVEKFDALSKDYDKNKSFNSAIAVNYKDGC